MAETPMQMMRIKLTARNFSKARGQRGIRAKRCERDRVR
jgi:hypothetical protein